jgi:2-hydroxychromene-2-carboxylate isomerase
MNKTAAPIDFYFDFSSPYGYFAATKIDALAAQYQRDVAWHPVLLGVVFRSTGAQPLTMVPMKGDYSRRDFGRTARLHDIPFSMPQTFPIASQIPARAMLHIRAAHGRHRANAFALAAFHAFFVDGINISEAPAVAKIAASLGLDADAVMDGAQSQEIKDQLKAGTEQAIARQVFGSPFFIVDDEPFWGFDRLDQLRHFLQHGSI